MNLFSKCFFLLSLHSLIKSKKTFSIFLVFSLSFSLYAEKERGFANIYYKTHFGFSKFYELVLSERQIISNLEWKSHTLNSTEIGFDIFFPSGYIFGANFLFIPGNIPHTFIDEDFMDNILFSYSEHQSKNIPSYEISIHTGRQFKIKTFPLFDVQNILFISPGLRVRILNYGFSAADGFGFKIRDNGEKIDNRYYGWQISYSCMLFCVELLSNFQWNIGDKLSWHNNIGINMYFNGITYDYHVKRNIHFYDYYHFVGIFLSLHSQLLYNIQQDFGILVGTNYDFIYSDVGSLMAIFADTNSTVFGGKGVSGVKHLKCSISIGCNITVNLN